MNPVRMQTVYAIIPLILPNILLMVLPISSGRSSNFFGSLLTGA